MPKSHIIDSLREERKSSLSSNIFSISPVLNIKEGESIVVTYTSASALDKIKAFSAFVREGLESGDAVNYVYPDEERLTVWTMLKDSGIDVEKYEKAGTLRLESLTEHFISNGKLDYEKAINNSLDRWFDVKRKGYKHIRDIEDIGDFSFVNGKWKKYITRYWLDPEWDDPNVSIWAVSGEPIGVVYEPFIMEITAINVERMTETQINELLKTMGKGTIVRTRIIELFRT